MNDILNLASKEELRPAAEDTQRALLLAIDMQNDFMEGGELGVPGSLKDCENLNRFIYANMEKISGIMVSLDTHIPQQIFHPCWWFDHRGNHPDPFTIISAADVQDGKWLPINPKESLEYVVNLEKVGRKSLCIWPYHCLDGTQGSALEGQFANMVYFHSVAKKSSVDRIVKGQDPFTEMYGIVKPEYDPNHFVNDALLNKLKTYQIILVAGEAKSHCVYESVRQIVDYYSDHPDITSRIYVLEDCMSSIQGYEEATELSFLDMKNRYNINIVNTRTFSF